MTPRDRILKLTPLRVAANHNKPMIVGYHVIFTAYGFWLPNDPRGSWSNFVGSWELFRYGKATKTTETRSLANRQHNSALRQSAKSALKYPPVQFTGRQARAVARGFSHYIDRSNLPVWACAILPDHVHLVLGRGHLTIEQLVIRLNGAATRQLEREKIHPFAKLQSTDQRLPKCWAGGQWKVFLDPEDVDRAIDYVENNPLKEGKKKQQWSFVSTATR